MSKHISSLGLLASGMTQNVLYVNKVRVTEGGWSTSRKLATLRHSQGASFGVCVQLGMYVHLHIPNCMPGEG